MEMRVSLAETDAFACGDDEIGRGVQACCQRRQVFCDVRGGSKGMTMMGLLNTKSETKLPVQGVQGLE